MLAKRLPETMPVESATARPRSPVSVTVQARRHEIVQDKPGPAGQDEGPMASEFLLAALLGCQHSTFVRIAAKRRVEATVSSLQGTLHFDDAGDIEDVHVHFVLDVPVAVTDGQIMQVCRLTDRACTISKALSVPVNFSYERNKSSK